MAKLKDISDIAHGLGIRQDELELSGRYKAKIDPRLLERLKRRRNAKYILVSAITPTSLGEGKTVTTIALSMALNRLKYKSAATLRQSSLGPLFGAKGVASGGGASCVLPQGEINLHFTGDTHAVGTANNLLVSFLENSIFHGNALKIDPATITFKRCLDINDRSLRHINYSLRSNGERIPAASGFEITAASEVMSILALSLNLPDMLERLRDITVARNYAGELVCAADLGAAGMMAAVLAEAIKPNLVQTNERTPCFIHSGPFANVSVGSSSIIADKMALSLCDYVVTESGFGVDCGAEKFFDIKCRASGEKPDLCVLVCSVRGLKAQSLRLKAGPGGKIDPALFAEDMEALAEGAQNLRKHIENVKLFGIMVVVGLNIFSTDTRREIDFVIRAAKEFGAGDAVETTAFADGSAGAISLAQSVLKHTQGRQSQFRFLYECQQSIRQKIEAVASKVYGAASVDYAPEASRSIDFYTQRGFAHLPVCIAKTQFSLSHDESLKGAPRDFIFPVKDVRLCSGARFILAHASLMQTMPGLPAEPRGRLVGLDLSGKVTGLS